MSKFRNELVLLCLIYVVTNAFATLTSNITAAMEQNGIVPDVIDEAPKALIEVKYVSGVAAKEGNVLTPTQVKDTPNVTWEADPNKFYALLLTDPDAPSRKEPIYREWHHWLVVNIPGSKVDDGETLSEYVGSGPPPDTGLHRYVFLVFEQSGKLSFSEPKLTNTSGDHRGKFSTKDFINKYSLGTPIAGNFYQAEFDDYVPKLYDQLAGKGKA